MKRILLLTAVLLLCAATTQSSERTEDEMKAAAMQVLQGGTAGSRRRAASTAELKELKVLPMLRIYGYTDGGFAVVSADDRFDAVIGYSDTQFADTMPCGFKWWLEASNAVMEQEVTCPTTAARAKGVVRAVRRKISPMLTTKWGQQRPYNNSCCYNIAGKNYEFLTGCVATAMAQVMRYHRFPAQGQGNHSYVVRYDVGNVRFSADFSNSRYEWNEMLDTYGYNYTTLRKTDSHTKAVAQLMSDCGIAVDMSYNGNVSSAATSKIAPALKEYFLYDDRTQLYKRKDYLDSEWMDMIYKELEHKRPLIYRGVDSSEESAVGHAFVIHGMDESGKVYVNWGWSGSYDGYFSIDNLKPDGNSYNNDQEMVVIEPGVNIFNVYMSSTGRGTVTYNGNMITGAMQLYKVEEGSEVALSIKPDNGYQIGSILVNGENKTSLLSDGQLLLSDISSNMVINVSFEKKRNKLSLSSSGGGCVCLNELELRNSESNVEIEDSTTVTLTLHPDKYYRLTEFLVNGEDVMTLLTGNTYKVNVTTNLSVYAKFDIKIAELIDDELDFIQWDEQELVYTGKQQKLTWKNKLGENGLMITSDGLTNHVDAGTFSDEIPMSLKYGDDTRQIKVSCKYTIKSANLIGTVQNVQRTYGSDNPLFTVKYTGFVNGETEAVLTNKGVFKTDATKDSPAGEYAITLSGVEAKNYNVTTKAGKLTIVICKLTVKVVDAERVYGEDNPKFTYEVTGLINGDKMEDVLTSAGTFTTTATKTSSVGEYVVKYTGMKAENYDVKNVDGILKVTPASLKAKVNDATKTYGEDNPQFSTTFIGFVNGDTEQVLTNKGSYVTTATKTSDVGMYDITLIGVEAKNYILNKVEPGTLTIEQTEQQIVWNQEPTLLGQYSQLELTAKATSGLPVSYQVLQGSDVCSVVKIGNATFLDCFGTGDVTLSAWQEGNKNYYPTLRTYKQVKVVPTGIGHVEAGDYTVVTKRGQLLIGGLKEGDTVQVTDLAGRTVYSGEESTIYVTSGSYIMRIGHWTKKVLMK